MPGDDGVWKLAWDDGVGSPCGEMTVRVPGAKVLARYQRSRV